MPRPRKNRRVCRLPAVREFRPAGRPRRWIVLTVDEYETLRLIDREGCSQEQCAVQMQVARTTVQQIYTTARAKLAEALVEGAGIRIEGGSYTLCTEEKTCDGRCQVCVSPH